MAKAASSPFEMQLKDVEKRIAAQEAVLAKAQEAYRKDPTNADLRAAVQQAKEPLMQLSIDRGFYARANSEALGGKSHMPPA